MLKVGNYKLKDNKTARVTDVYPQSKIARGYVGNEVTYWDKDGTNLEYPEWDIEVKEVPNAVTDKDVIK